MKDIRVFLRSLILFIPFSVLIYSILVIIGGSLPYQYLKPNINYKVGAYGFMYSRIREIPDYQNTDILFLGSSHSYRSFDPRIFKKYGLKCFNLGSSNQTPIQTEVLIRRYLNRLNPKMIIFEVSPISFSGDGVESSLDLMANDKNDFLTVTKLVKWDNLKTINTAIYAFYRDLLNLNYHFVENRERWNDVYVPGGFVEKGLTFYKPVNNFEKKRIDIKDKQVSAFERCLNIIHSKNIKLILVQAPITKSLYTSYVNSGAFDSLMENYGEYYNFNKLLNLTDTVYFFDEHHLNQLGVNIFDEYLIKLLEPELKALKHNKTIATKDFSEKP